MGTAILRELTNPQKQKWEGEAEIDQLVMSATGEGQGDMEAAGAQGDRFAAQVNDAS